MILLVLLLVACNQQQPVKQDSNGFEGYVEMDIRYQSDSSQVIKLFKKISGVKAVTYIKEGLIAREYIDSNGIILFRELYNRDSLKYYYYDKSDTIKYRETQTDQSCKLEKINKLPNKIILGKSCSGLLLTFKFWDDKMGKIEQGDQEYFFDTTCNLPKDVYENCKYCSYDELFAKYPYLNYEVKTDFGIATMTMTATKIVKTPLSDATFALPKNKTFVKLL